MRKVGIWLFVYLASFIALTAGVEASTDKKNKSIAEFTKNMNKHQGYFDFYYDDDTGKLFLSVDKLNTPFLFQSSLPNGVGSNDIGLDRGQLGDSRLAQFEKHGNKLLLKQLNTYFQANTDNQAERESVKEAFASSIFAGFKISAKSNNTYLIDYTNFLLSDIHGVQRRLSATKQGKFSPDKTRSAVYAKRSKAFPHNTELESIVTFKGSKPGKFVKQVAPDPYSITVHLHHSFIKLPDNSNKANTYTPRVFHPYSGFWSIEFKDYGVGLDDSMYTRYIPRHRLNKKNPNASVSESVEPIIYYLDPGAPEPVKTALIDGAMWWNQAFESIGYKNAFQVKVLPKHADPMDVRYNTIQWVHRATRGWSYGASVIDPRSGEIIKGHVTLGSLRVRQDYLIAQGLLAPFKNAGADTSKLKSMALARIRQLSAHEVGHTLGIAHNFAASVNDRASVMDYPHPLVKLSDNGDIDVSDAYAEDIGVWDKHVIAYGYSDYTKPENAIDSELTAIIQKAKNAGLKYQSDPDSRPKSGVHTEGHLWDNGKDPAVELLRMSKIRAKAIGQFSLDNIRANTATSQLEEVLVPIYLFHRFQVEATAKIIAGGDYSYSLKRDIESEAYSIASANKQLKAMDAMLTTITPEFLTLPQSILNLIPPKSYGESRNRESFKSRTGIAFDPLAAAESSAQHTLSLLLNPERLNRLYQQQLQLNSPLLDSLFEKLSATTFEAKPASGLSLGVQTRVQSLTLENIARLTQNKKLIPEVKAKVLTHLESLGYNFKKSANHLVKHPELQAQLKLFNKHIDWLLKTGKWTPLIEAVKMPPGSPI